MKFRVWDIELNLYAIPDWFSINGTGKLLKCDLGPGAFWYEIENTKKYKIEYSIGWKDTNKKEIFHGDFIEWPIDGQTALIVPVLGGFHLKTNKDFYIAALWEILESIVIGNINENPELMERVS